MNQFFPPIISGMFDVLAQSIEDLLGRISEVKYGRLELDVKLPEGGTQYINFKLDNRNFEAPLAGKFAIFCIGFSELGDRKLACRLFLDGLAKEIV